ncbi:hypothetical protein GJAV_G00119840 [Gymnothorax javanicus]|nr:hypothetical protein GJAV_G00119840 [Gymnothorax javanicus]
MCRTPFLTDERHQSESAGSNQGDYSHLTTASCDEKRTRTAQQTRITAESINPSPLRVCELHVLGSVHMGDVCEMGCSLCG